MTQSQSPSAKAAAIFFWEGYLSVAPSLLNAAHLLSSVGIEVDFYVRKPLYSYAEMPQLPKTVRVIECHPISYTIRRVIKGNAPITLPSAAATANQANTNALRKAAAALQRDFVIALDILQFMILGWRCALTTRYGVVIGIDMMGVAVAGLLNLFRRLPLIYWSLELIYMHELHTPLLRWLKRCERGYSQQALFSVIQDNLRAQSLQEENQLTGNNILIIPNAPFGTAELSDRTFFQRLFGLADNVDVLLHIGMLEPAVMAVEVAGVAPHLPPNCEMVFHERMQRSEDDPYLREVVEAGSGRVRLSLKPVPLDQLDRIVASGHIGLVVYRADIGLNYSLIVGASGKLAYYLRCGLPIICNDLPGFRELVDETQCGIVVRTLDEIPDAVRQIRANYAQFSQNALKCYEERYEFGTFFQPLLDTVRAITGASARK